MPSVFDGLLVSVNATVPTGVEAVPKPVSVTVMVNIADPPIGAVAVVGATVVVVERAVTVKVAAGVVLLLAWTLSVAAKLAFIVCAPVGAVAVAVTVQLTVPTEFAPCASVQVLKLSLLAGLLASLNDTVPAGFDAVPVLVSFTVIVNCAD